MRRSASLALPLPVTLACHFALGDEARLLRFPTTHGHQVVFTYAGDLYTVPTAGGVARRLTSHDGFEMFPRFSPDGKWIAFTGQYDGNTEVYRMPAEGGVPVRLTYTSTLGRDEVSDRMGPNNIVMGWTPDGSKVVFRSRMRSFNSFVGQLYTVSAEGGIPEQLPLPRGGFCSYSPDGSKLAYNRVFREFRTWKRYRGGMADDVWVHDFKAKTTERITTDRAQDIMPMWHGDRIYFLSDRGPVEKMNLYSFDLKTRELDRHTDYRDFDIKFPSLGDRALVYENGGWIYRFDLESQRPEKVEVRILEDRALARGELVSVSDKVTNYEIGPKGERALFGARGEVFTVPAPPEAGRPAATRNLTNTSGAHERNSKWSPDGEHIAYVSDASGEDEIYLTTPDSLGDPVRLTDGADTYKYEIYWAPDSKKILWTDKKLRLFYVDVESKKRTRVQQAKQWEIRDAVWSPDSNWIAWSQAEANGQSKVYLYSLKGNEVYPVTAGRFNSSGPAFSGDGKYLFFISDRDFRPIYSATEWNHAYRDMSRIYLVTLAKDTPDPFHPRSDGPEKKAEDKPKKGEDKKEEKEEPETKDLTVDVEGLGERLLRLPVKAARYRNLQSVGGKVFYIRNGSDDSKPALQVYDVDAQKETALGSVGGFEISADGKKMLVSQSGKYGIVDLPKGPVTVSKPLDLSGMEMMLDKHAEWNQIFHESWRQMRDFFYDPNMHGVDWRAMRERYLPLVPHVNHRADLTYVIGEMISELNVGHAYVSGGEMPRPRRIPLGHLGATLEKDAKSGYFRIKSILRTPRWDPSLRSPLNALGVNAKEGDFILEVNGKSTADMPNLYAALVNTVGKQVTLKLNGKPAAQGAREVIVIPIANEADLIYHQWVEGNLKKVAKATDGKVGYLHVPDMGPAGLNQFVRYFYPQLDKKALIIDVRGNGGGNVSPMLIERLRREIAMITIARNTAPGTSPSAMVWGPKVCLMDEFSASDGDLFPWQFQHHKIGKLIGKRSWGGVVGIRGSLPLLDGGDLRRPEFSRYDVAGKKWLIEGYGVDPDIVVDNDPAKEYAGEDQQLDRAIAEVLKELETREKTIPPPPPTPKK